MYKVRRLGSPNNIRDINIAIAYHNTGRSMKDVGLEFGISSRRIEQIHHVHVRHVLICNDKYTCVSQTARKNHCAEVAVYLQEYKDYLLGGGMKVEVTVDDLLGNAGLVLSAHDNEGAVFVRVCNDNQPEYYVEVSIEDLKAAVRKLSAK